MSDQALPFLTRLWMAFVCFFQILLKPWFAAAVLPQYELLTGLPPKGENRIVRARPEDDDAEPEPEAPPPTVAPEQLHASALFILAALQREGRLIDFLQDDVGPYPDAQVGAAARVVHAGCRKVLSQYLSVEPVMRESEGARVTVPPGFDAERIRLTGNVRGKPPFSGALKHHGWVTGPVKFPEVSAALDPRVLAPAEVELS